MNKRQRLAQQLAELKEADWFAVLKEARAKRIQRDEKRKEPKEPTPGMPAEEVAAWIAWHHLRADPELIKVIYLPAHAPEDEIRLLEIFDTVIGPPTEPIEPLDFSPVSPETNYRVLAADVTTQQWSRIRKGESLLPAGWSMEGARTFRRGKPG